MVLSLLVSLLVGGVEVAPDAPCVDARSAPRLAAQVPAEVTVSLTRGKPDVLVVVLSSPGRTSLRREVPASANECEAVERVVLALVRSWSMSLSPRRRADAGAESGGGSAPAVSGADVGARELNRSDAGTSSRSSESGSVVRETNGLDAGLSSPSSRSVEGGSIDSSSSVDAGPRKGRASPESDAGPSASSRGSSRESFGFDAGSSVSSFDSGRESVGFDAGPSVSSRGSGRESGDSDAGSISPLGPGPDLGVRDAGESSGSSSRGASDAGTSELRLGLSVLGGVSSGTTADVLPQGLLSFDLVWRWLGVAVDLGLSGGVKQTVAPGEIVASWQWLSLSGRAVWSPTERLLLDLQLGARAHRLVASATGFTMNEPAQSLFSVGGVGSVGASLRLLGPFGVVVRATGVLKPPERFVITNVPQALDFGPLEGAVHAGLFARW